MMFLQLPNCQKVNLDARYMEDSSREERSIVQATMRAIVDVLRLVRLLIGISGLMIRSAGDELCSKQPDLSKLPEKDPIFTLNINDDAR
ncbi:hypothetical protein BELL_0153g00100 [Botrytis elliptica]|uniref:Uncharacterized protein n=1 Tax=Botrytis elliptica TaxID=278938 RepID=A0A4Z1JT86_9HELO|nr:hypothetical protein BELL_0153g00100 [Botrytis elliptica]